MKAYMYQAALYCEACAADLETRLTVPPGANLDDESTYNSDAYPKGPYAYGGGESDTPNHCDACGVFLENPLTPDGDEYVREQIRLKVAPPGTRELSWSETAYLADEIGKSVIADWIRFYLAGGM